MRRILASAMLALTLAGGIMAFIATPARSSLMIGAHGNASRENLSQSFDNLSSSRGRAMQYALYIVMLAATAQIFILAWTIPA
jgi:hypothetical protein